MEAAIGLISSAQWRGQHIEGLSQKFGISSVRARAAYYEATRHLRLNMGGHLERLEVSVAWTARQRDEARTKGDSAEKRAEDWRRREREASDKAATASSDEDRAARLNDAARFGLVAAKYGLEAEKWHAQALAHQRHLDDIQCLRGPREVNAMQVNLGGDGLALLTKFGALLAARFASRPDVLAEIDAASAEVEGGITSGAIDTTGEAA